MGGWKGVWERWEGYGRLKQCWEMLEGIWKAGTVFGIGWKAGIVLGDAGTVLGEGRRL